MSFEDRDFKIGQIEGEILCDALDEFIEVMIEEVGASKAEIKHSVVKELEYFLSLKNIKSDGCKQVYIGNAK
jgi:hypothetical protein